MKKNRLSMDQLEAAIRFRKAVDGKQVSVNVLLGGLLSSDPLIADMAYRALLRVFPMAALPVRLSSDAKCIPTADHPEIPEWIGKACSNWGDEGDFVDRCIDYCEVLSPDEQRCLLPQMARFWGAHRAFMDRLKARGHRTLGKAFGRHVVETHNRQYPRQICFSPTLNCQLHCNFCISKGLVASKSMPFSKVREMVSWARRSNVKRVCLSGGEPTLYPHFPDTMSLLESNGFDVLVATNGLGDEACMDAICKVTNIHLTMHLTPEHKHFPGVMERNVKTLHDAGKPMALRLNFVDGDDDYQPYLDKAEQLGLYDVRFAVPMPNARRGNRFIPVDQLAPFASLIANVWKSALDRGLRPNLAKPFPLCRLPEHVARDFIANGSMISNCQVSMQKFSHNLVIHPDMRFSPCLALNDTSDETILSQHGVRHAGMKQRTFVEGLMHEPLLPACSECPLSVGGRCLGGCLSYRLNSCSNEEAR